MTLSSSVCPCSMNVQTEVQRGESMVCPFFPPYLYSQMQREVQPMGLGSYSSKPASQGSVLLCFNEALFAISFYRLLAQKNGKWIP